MNVSCNAFRIVKYRENLLLNSNCTNLNTVRERPIQSLIHSTMRAFPTLCVISGRVQKGPQSKMNKKFRKIHEFVALCSRGGRSNVLKMLVWIGKLEFVAIIGTVRSRRRRPDIRHLTTRIKMLSRHQPTQKPSTTSTSLVRICLENKQTLVVQEQYYPNYLSCQYTLV